MSKRAEDLAFKYNIVGGVDELSLFISEIYNDGYHDGKAFKDRHITPRDHFAGLAMQGYLAGGIGDRQIDIEHAAQWSYEVADAMLEAREEKPE
jgi:hypothetical protein